MSNSLHKKALRNEVELLEKKIVYFTGRQRSRARQRYLRLLRSCGKTCGIDEPIYIDRK